MIAKLVFQLHLTYRVPTYAFDPYGRVLTFLRFLAQNAPLPLLPIIITSVQINSTHQFSKSTDALTHVKSFSVESLLAICKSSADLLSYFSESQQWDLNQRILPAHITPGHGQRGQSHSGDCLESEPFDLQLRKESKLHWACYCYCSFANSLASLHACPLDQCCVHPYWKGLKPICSTA